VIVNFKNIENLKRCLESLTETTYSPIEIIVVDCMTENIETWIETSFSHVKLIHFDHDIGPSASHNVGFNNSKGEFIAFLDNDTRVDPKWLEEPLSLFEKYPDAAVIQPMILQMYEQKRIDRAYNYIDLLGFGHHVGAGEILRNQFNTVKEVFYADGAAFIAKRDAIKNVLLNNYDLFDPSYIIYYDETDFCWRVHLRGYKIFFSPNSIVYHCRTLSSMRSVPSRLIFFHARNRIATLIKNYSSTNLIKHLPTLLFFEFSRALVLLRVKPLHSLAILKAIFASFRNLKNLWKKRLVVQLTIRKVPDSYYVKLMRKPNILFMYHAFTRYYAH
jgi:GT2 family glycosyltransferase